MQLHKELMEEYEYFRRREEEMARRQGKQRLNPDPYNRYGWHPSGRGAAGGDLVVIGCKARIIHIGLSKAPVCLPAVFSPVLHQPLPVQVTGFLRQGAAGIPLFTGGFEGLVQPSVRASPAWCCAWLMDSSCWLA